MTGWALGQNKQWRGARHRLMAVAAALALVLAGCRGPVPRQGQFVLPKQARIYVAIPRASNAEPVSRTTRTSLGRLSADAFGRQFARVTLGSAPESSVQAMGSANNGRRDYLVYPEVTQWREGEVTVADCAVGRKPKSAMASQAPSEPCRGQEVPAVYSVRIYDVASRSLLDSMTWSGPMGWKGDRTGQVGEQVARPLQAFAESLSGRR